jgi:hypothetical protein
VAPLVEEASQVPAPAVPPGSAARRRERPSGKGGGRPLGAVSITGSGISPPR